MVTRKNPSKLSTRTQQVRTTSVGWRLNMAANRMDDALKTALAPLGLSHHQFIILMSVGENDGITQSELGKIANLPGYAVSRNLDYLEERNLLKRHPDQHSRRSFNLKLTDTGRAFLPQLFKAVAAVNEEVLLALTSTEQTQLSELLGKIIERQSGE